MIGGRIASPLRLVALRTDIPRPEADTLNPVNLGVQMCNVGIQMWKMGVQMGKAGFQKGIVILCDI